MDYPPLIRFIKDFWPPENLFSPSVLAAFLTRSLRSTRTARGAIIRTRARAAVRAPANAAAPSFGSLQTRHGIPATVLFT